MKKIFNILLLASIILFAYNCNPKQEKIKDESAPKTIVSADDTTYKHWVWVIPNDKDTDEMLVERFKKYFGSGIVGIYIHQDNERYFRIAKEQGLQTHRWIRAMLRPDVIKDHPDWAAVSRAGRSTADNPPYVNYYRWMCPSKPEVLEFLSNEVKDQLSKDYIDGIHLDYIRFNDVVLAVNLWDQYDLKQTQELPEYDFCYCDLCKEGYKAKFKKDLDTLEYPTESFSWRTYRYGLVNDIVNHLSEIAHELNKPITAAVFPTPDIAKKLVLQDWTNWKVDAVNPMIYHGFYREKPEWIGQAVKEGVRGVQGQFPIYAGIYMPDFKNIQEIEIGIKAALDNGADGITIFGDRDEKVDATLDILSKYRNK